jgi:hypothetical protein
MSDTYLIGLWNRITIYCMNHEEPVEMEIVNNTEQIKTPFYACSNYFSEGCPNRLNLDDYQGLVLKFCDVVEKGGVLMDYTNYRFEYKGNRHKLFVKVLKYSDKEVRLGVLNKTILGHG